MEWWYLAVPLIMFLGVTSAQDTDENGLVIEPEFESEIHETAQPLEKLHWIDEKEDFITEPEETLLTEPEKSLVVEPVITPIIEPEIAASTATEETKKTPYEVIDNLPQWVDEVTSVCPWRSASDEHQQGYVRLIRTKKEGANHLYVQWMQKLPPNKDVALATRMIEEIAQGPKLAIEFPEQQLHSRFCKLTAYARSLENNNNYRISLKVEEPGKYQFELVQVLGRSSR